MYLHSLQRQLSVGKRLKSKVGAQIGHLGSAVVVHPDREVVGQLSRAGAAGARMDQGFEITT